MLKKNAIFLVFVPIFFIYTRFGLCGFPHFETQNWHSQKIEASFLILFCPKIPTKIKGQKC